ncbi:MAG TPA: FKBP-type peptidyl-prolyl cis-trans isomerase [Pyrinomonadaceae bacterium]|nr:FKBP-type peptidyl-prolyl cis-trans isomerase [Pyrinomonadaceae bacterium]
MPFSSSSVGPYTLIRELGRGASGVVWLGERRSEIATTQLALKLLNADEIDVDSLIREARLWVQASGHPNIIPIIEASVYDGQIVIVSEYAPDGSLLDWLERGEGRARSVQEAAGLIIGILSGLKHLHSRPELIIHGDLKPSNILLQGDSPRLTDIAIGSVIKTTTTAGTSPYMAPEALDGERTVQSDLWSVGVIFYQLITGELPILDEEPEFPVDTPDEFAQFIATALEKDPALRYASAEEMQRELRLICGTPEEEAPHYVPEVQRRKRNLETMLFAAFLILVVLFGVGYVMFQTVRDSPTVVTPSGLKYTDLKAGDGATPRLGQRVQVHYVGWLANGQEFQSSYKIGQPAEFMLGPALIQGWNEALQSMRVGGKRRVIIPSHLAYGAAGRPPMIPPNETLTFEIELLGIMQ